MKKNEYKCAMCGGIFLKGWSDEEAIEEAKGIGMSLEEMTDDALVCEDCYNFLMGKE